jgi:ribosomal protein S27E
MIFERGGMTTIEKGLGVNKFFITATCKKCGGLAYISDSDAGQGSSETGEWAFIVLTCQDCKEEEHVSLLH